MIRVAASFCNHRSEPADLDALRLCLTKLPTERGRRTNSSANLTRDEIRQRVDNFKAHQEKIAREREDYYLQVKAKMLALVDPNPVHPKQNSPA